MNNPRPALRHLSAQFLKREIQTSVTGHCSIEDATCAMQLAQVRTESHVKLRYIYIYIYIYSTSWDRKRWRWSFLG